MSAPDVTMPQQAAPDTNTPSAGGSRLGAILGAVAKTVDTGLSGIPQGRRPDFTSGLGSGARAEQQQQAVDQSIKFKSFDDQVRMAQLHNQDLHQQNETEEEQDKHKEADLNMRVMANNNGVSLAPIAANTSSGVMGHLTTQTTANGSSSVPLGASINSDGKTVDAPPQNAQTQKGFTDMYKRMAPALGLPALPPGQDFATPKNIHMMQDAMLGKDPTKGEYYNHDDLPAAIGNLKAIRDNLSKSGGTDDQLNASDKAVAYLQSQLDARDKHAAGVKQQGEQAQLDAQNSPQSIAGAAKKAAAIEAAKDPFEKAKAQMEQSVKDGDPASAGKMLANGDIAPSQIISTRNPAFAQQAFAEAKKADPNYNPQRAESEFKVASSPAQVGFFASAKSLTDSNGTLDQLEAAYKKLPNGQIPKLNTLADWTAASKGEGSTAGFAQTALGVADDYAKVMGGGQGSDSAREEMLKSFAMSSSPKQMESSIEAARAAVGSQMKSRIGSNKAMDRMYGDNIPQPSQFASAPGKPRMVSRDGGKSWQPALAQ